MKTINRRTYLKRIALVAAAGTFPSIFCPRLILAAETETQPMPTEDELAALDKIAKQFMEQYNAPGLSVAIARHGQFVYQKGFGFANKAAGERVTPSSLFRIASVSKPITSATIFSLIEQGRLGLDDLVFGPQGLLKFDYGESYPELVNKITVHHLLTHTCGGWQNNGSDPMFRNLKMNHKELITWAVHNEPLQYEPGQHAAYSNFGYCILGRVIEKVTGQTYVEFVKQTVLAKCGIKDMRLAGNTYAQRAPSEVVYYGQGKTNANPYNMNVSRMDSHGGWIATPSDLVQFAMHVDGLKATPNILNPDTIKTMTTPSTVNVGYACGWIITAINWWHNGSLPGSTSVLVRTATGLCWSAMINTRTEDGSTKGSIAQLMWKMVRAVPAWRA